MCKVGFDSDGYEGKGIATLLAAGFDHSQHRFDKATAGLALRSKRQLSPNHRMTQGSFARIVRRFDSFVPQEEVRGCPIPNPSQFQRQQNPAGA